MNGNVQSKLAITTHVFNLNVHLLHMAMTATPYTNRCPIHAWSDEGGLTSRAAWWRITRRLVAISFVRWRSFMLNLYAQQSGWQRLGGKAL